MTEVRLSWAELLAAAEVGIARRISSMRLNLDKFKHCEKSDWATDIDGAAAEMAVAKALDLYWDCSNFSFKRADLGGDIQVRSTNHKDGHLIVRENDKSGLFVLVISDAPNFRIAGIADAMFAKQDRFRRSDREGSHVV